MTRTSPLPPDLDDRFPVWLARAHGVTRGRLRSDDLTAPFHGVRIRRTAPAPDDTPTADPYTAQRRARIATVLTYLPRLHTGHFFSHETAAAIWGAPLPLEFDGEGRVAAAPRLHVCAPGAVPLPRATGVVGHRSLASMVSLRVVDGMRVSSPASTWAMLGRLPLIDLVALGDFFCRRWRDGHGRPDAGRPPLSTLEDLAEALEVGRRRGADRLRAALGLIREDSWSPRESRVRCILVSAGLPEPALNLDVHGPDGRFLACVDMAYPELRIAIEYLGMLHGDQWARDVERMASLRAAGWIVIEVTAPLLQTPERLIARVRAARASRVRASRVRTSRRVRGA